MNFLRVNNKFVVIALFLVGMIGCNVQETKPSVLATDGVNLGLVDEVASIAESDVQKIAFRQMLTPADRIYLFKKRIMGKLQTLPLNSEQRDHLNLLLANMTPDMYDGRSEQGKKSVEYVTQWTRVGRGLFEQATLRDIVGSLTPDQKGVQKEQPKPRAGAPCTCATASSYCGDGWGCSYIPSCNDSGCGTMWVYTCNGNCDQMASPYTTGQ